MFILNVQVILNRDKEEKIFLQIVLQNCKYLCGNKKKKQELHISSAAIYV